ncbi:MAG: phosphoglucosamine mutase [Candidatus Margulisbacteria bacterium]|nr:phosphoglucosamine mutase [Candidatus Margulisiibacteriota bacterium]
MTLKISISGVRGTVPDSLTPEVCLDFAKAFGTYLVESPKYKVLNASPTIVIGTDPRATSEFIKGIVLSGILSTGCRIIDIGICPTPTVGIMVRHLKADGGIIITASHNPLPYNGLKFVREDGIFLNEKQALKLIDIYSSKKFFKGALGKLTSNTTAIDFHIKQILNIFKPSNARRKKTKVVIDAVNGAGSEAAVRLLEKYGCNIVAVNCDLSQPFPHPPEPIPENLTQLCQIVKEEKSDVGFAFDADADRLAIVSEKGEPIGEELTLALCTKYILDKYHTLSPKKKIVITNLSTTKAIDDIVRSQQGTVIRTKIGEVHVAEELLKMHGLIGGEGNGGVIFPQIGFNRDSLIGVAIILQLMKSSGKKISELAGEVPGYVMVKSKFDCPSQDETELFLERIKEKFKRKDLILTDGVKVMLPEGWVHVRASNTEPVIRVIAEAKTQAGARGLISQVLEPAG